MFKIFVSPRTTLAERKAGDKDDLLTGNLFTKPGVKLGKSVYKSLLETVALQPKKKHLKKIIEHMMRHSGTQVAPELLDLAVYIGIEQRLPILMGHYMKHFLQNDYPVSVECFKEFVLFLERCKGFEEDAKRFVILTSETKHVQADYSMLRPLFMRAIRNKTGNDVLKLFE